MRSLRPLFRFILRIQGLIVLGARIDREAGCVEIRVRPHGNAKCCCQHCLTKLTGGLKTVRSRWRHLDLLSRRTYLVADRREGYCAHCGGRRLESVRWAGANAFHTHAFDRKVAGLVQVANRTAVARMFDVTWRTAGRMISRVVKDELPADLLKGLRYIAVDETSHKRGHRYLTVVSDLLTGRVVWIDKGRSAATLKAFFDKLGKRRSAAIELVTMDMSAGYQKAVHDWAKNAEIVFDKFHIVQLLTKAIDEVRREECRLLTGDARKALKGTRYPLLRNPNKHTEKDVAAIEQIKRTNGRLYRAWELRADFENLWECDSEKDAENFLMRWTRAALLSRREPLRKLAATLREHLDGILAHFRWGGPTNAQAEGINNKIKLLIHKAFGFRSVENLMAMIYLCCTGIELG